MEAEWAYEWLTKSIPGILLLGALGSILGAIVISLLGKVKRKALNSKEKLILRILYAYGRNIEIGRKVRGSLSKRGDGLEFVVYHVNETAGFLFLSMFFFGCLMVTAIVIIFFGIDRPLLLSFTLALDFISLFYLVKHGVQLESHVTDDFQKKVMEIERGQPKKFSDWHREITSPDSHNQKRKD